MQISANKFILPPLNTDNKLTLATYSLSVTYFLFFILSRSNFLNISWLIRYMKKITQFWLVKINAVLGNSMQKRVDSVQRSNKPDWTIPWTVQPDFEPPLFIFFSEGTVTNSAIWLVLYLVSIFLSLPTGNGNAFVGRRAHPFIRCHFSQIHLVLPAGQYF